MRVKICGTATFADLACALTAGADAIGFLMDITHVTQDAMTPKAGAVRRVRPYAVVFGMQNEPWHLLQTPGAVPDYLRKLI